MGSDAFLVAVQELAERNLTLADLIGAAEASQQAGEFGLAIQLYALWIRLNQDHAHLPAAHFNHGVLLARSGDLNGSKCAMERALALNPDFFPGYVGLCNALEALGAAGDALGQWAALSQRLASVTRSAIDYKITALRQAGRILVANRRSSDAERILSQALELDPAQPDIVQSYLGVRLAQCEWPVVAPWPGVSNKMLMQGMGPLSMAVYSDDPMLHFASAWRYEGGSIDERCAALNESRRPVAADYQPRRRRVGYVSSDLCNHAVGALLAEFFEFHDRSAFEVFAYYSGPATEDALQARIKPAIEHWIDIRDLDDTEAARRIESDGIDILVDLNGHTKGARTKIFAQAPAPVIVNWLGYPGTMATSYHHYIIADDWIVPGDHELYYSEKVLRLPCYQANDRKRVVSPRRPSRREAGLPEDAVVFCCFNDVHKIIRFTFERWMTILQRVPSSVLWLLSGSEAANANLLAAAARCGIAPERLIFADLVPHADHLARVPLADLFLDTAPYGAHVTGSDVLWMGVPILTLSGRSFASRVCGSLLRCAGVPELVCTTPDEYVERAVALGHDRAEITRLKQRLAASRKSCTLFAVDKLVRDLEDLYRHMWNDFLRGSLPRPDLANFDVYLDVGCAIDHEAIDLMAVADYATLYHARMARRHRVLPIGEDRRLWTAADIARWTAAHAEPAPGGHNIYAFPATAAE